MDQQNTKIDQNETLDKNRENTKFITRPVESGKVPKIADEN